jgi:hypothetical protein
MNGALCEPLAAGFLAAIWTRTGGEEVAAFPPPFAFSSDQTRSELWTGTMGARRAWTVSIISVLSIPWR